MINTNKTQFESITKLDGDIKTANFFVKEMFHDLAFENTNLHKIPIIFGIKNDGSVWCYTYKYSFQLEAGLKPNKLKDYNVIREWNSFQLFETSVKDIRIYSSNELFILDTHGDIWTLDLNISLFPFINNADVDKEYLDMNPTNDKYSKHKFRSFSSDSDDIYLITTDNDLYDLDLNFKRSNVLNAVSMNPPIFIERRKTFL